MDERKRKENPLEKEKKITDVVFVRCCNDSVMVML